ncbi:hypothetical protein KFK09_003208 [Dendrobium nobile]|uniref:Uncharacterized protein n=1 Tax=Dendrobium nobile TaxID=94219 RepID=A0A8T3C9G0_DENNO|nr:hypothetical protein KFK09_003208 [Dendrobium nobile]
MRDTSKHLINDALSLRGLDNWDLGINLDQWIWFQILFVCNQFNSEKMILEFLFVENAHFIASFQTAATMNLEFSTMLTKNYFKTMIFQNDEFWSHQVDSNIDILKELHASFGAAFLLFLKAAFQ